MLTPVPPYVRLTSTERRMMRPFVPDMRPGFSDAVQTYWIDWSRCEVYRRYFHADEYDGAPEPCPNWYQP